MSGEDAIAAAMARAREKAGAVIAANFIHPAWAMDAGEFVTWWGGTRLASVATVGASGWPHASPLEVTLTEGRFLIPAFADSVRVRDLRANPRLAVTTWDDGWHAAIVYARVDSVGERLVARPTRIYAMRAPAGHPAYKGR